MFTITLTSREAHSSHQHSWGLKEGLCPHHGHTHLGSHFSVLPPPTATFTSVTLLELSMTLTKVQTHYSVWKILLSLAKKADVTRQLPLMYFPVPIALTQLHPCL